MATVEFKKIGFGQVEPNKLSGQKTGEIFASLPLAKEVEVLQNGEFMFYNYYKGAVTSDDVATKTGEKMTQAYMVWNEIKIYEDYLTRKDFAMIRVGDNYVTNIAAIGRVTTANIDGTTYGGGSYTLGGYYGDAADPSITDRPYLGTAHTEYPYRMEGICPRVMVINLADVWTTNMIEGDLPEKSDNSGKGAEGTLLKLKKSDRNTLVLSPDGDVTDMQFVIVKDYTMPDGQRGFKVQRIA